MRQAVPLARRPFDVVVVVFFAVNLLFTTYVVSLEQLVIADPGHYAPPLWPPAPLLALVHWYERSYDPLLLARPAWYRATIWIDVLGFGPFYLVALYAWIRGRDWIRIPSVMWSTMMFTNVFIILFDELMGDHATPHPLAVVAANAAWLVMPILVLARVARSEHPFTRSAGEAGPPQGAVA
ncbi:MAG TPA: emopamil-binding family protein [Anaeromyxobacteraceae bacterium]|nr:emopamil-binding family protein [Anaeromyxobacteraceae bacterium]